MKIGIINTFTSNIQSVINALKLIGYTDYIIINSYDDYNKSCSHLIFPGVGTFDSNMKVITDKKIDLIIKDAFKNNIFYLGICVGMQILATIGKENGDHKGLDIIKGTVQKLKNFKHRLPHIGWSEINIIKKDNLLKEIKDKECFYFVHSYFFNTYLNENVIAFAEYENSFPSIIKKNNFYGVQFHPEKSQTQGLRLIKNFLDLK